MGKNRSVFVVAVDFEAASLKALELSKQLAACLGAEVAIVHIYQLPVRTLPGLEPTLVPGVHFEVAEAARSAIAALAEAEGGLRSMLREGDPATEIVALAEQEKAFMIAMGTHGRKGLSHFLLGSVAEQVVRRSAIPVLTVRAP